MLGLEAGAGSEATGLVDAVYIHKVQPIRKTYGAGDPTVWRRLGIVFVDTFVDAALHAATVRAFFSFSE